MLGGASMAQVGGVQCKRVFFGRAERLPKAVCQRGAGSKGGRCGAQYPRGNGKSFLAAQILLRCLTPGDSLHVPGAEYLLCAASIEQARLCYRFIRAEIEGDTEYSIRGQWTRLGITQTVEYKLRVLSATVRRQWVS